jgi:hypothetical protein
MKQQTKIAIAIFLAGFFTKDIIDCIFFLQIDQYPLSIFGFTITATVHKTMLAVSTVLTVGFLYYAFGRNTSKTEKSILSVMLLVGLLFASCGNSGKLDLTACEDHAKNCPKAENCPEHPKCEAHEKCPKAEDCKEHPECEAFEHKKAN